MIFLLLSAIVESLSFQRWCKAIADSANAHLPYSTMASFPEMRSFMNTRQIHELLYTLGIGRHYLGHNITVDAIQLILCDKDSLLHVKDGVLIPIAAQHQCDWRAVERNIRTVIHRAWTLNRPLVEHMHSTRWIMNPRSQSSSTSLPSMWGRARGNIQGLWSITVSFKYCRLRDDRETGLTQAVYNGFPPPQSKFAKIKNLYYNKCRNKGAVPQGSETLMLFTSISNLRAT